MKKSALVRLSALLLFFAACKSAAHKNAFVTMPAAGTFITADSMPVTEDKLNKFMFAVSIVADSDIADGVYDVNAHYEYHDADGKFIMPKEIKSARPLIRTGKDPYTYVIGFKIAGDTTFYDYFEVRATESSIRMEYLEAYTF